MKEKLRRFFTGRYGQDALNKALFVVILALFVVYLFTKWLPVYILSLLVFAVIFFRMLSRNIQSRSRENLAFQRLIAKPKRFFQRIRGRFAKGKTHRIYRCPSCRKELSVPKGKGNITITCPKCRLQFKKRT